MQTLHKDVTELEVEIMDVELTEIETIEAPELDAEQVEDLNRAVDSYETVEDYNSEIWGG